MMRYLVINRNSSIDIDKLIAKKLIAKKIYYSLFKRVDYSLC